MSKDRKNKSSRQAPAASPEPSGPPALWLRVLISVVVVWHLLVVFLSPLSVPPSSQVVVDIAQSPSVRWYSDQLYLNHGYHFFGPEPPVNQLVRYQVRSDTGELIAEGEFPDKQAQRPRLFYHRHMMLADQANLGPPDIDRDEWLRLSMRAYGRELLRKHDGASVRVDCVRHGLLFPGQSQAGDDPNAPAMFTPVASVEESAAALEQPLPVPAAPIPEPPFEPGSAEPLPLEGAS